MAAADGAVAAGVIGSLDCRAAAKSSRQTFHVAIRHASRPFRRSSIGMWIFFSGVPNPDPLKDPFFGSHGLP